MPNRYHLPSTMTNQDKRNLILRYIEAYNAFDMDGMLATLHPDVDFRNMSGEEMTVSTSGLDEFRQIAEKAKELVSEREQFVTQIDYTDSDSISVEIDYTGVPAVDLPNGLKAGETIQMKGKSEFRFKDDKISLIVDYSYQV